MMRIAIGIMAATLLGGAGIASEARAQEPNRMVSVRADTRTGHGITRRRGDECFVIAPDHVVQGSLSDPNRDAPDIVWITASGERRIPTAYRATPAEDIALLLVERSSENAEGVCASWPRGVLSMARLASMGRGAVGRIQGRDSRGEHTEFPVVLDEWNPASGTFTILPNESRHRFAPGVSGSLVLIKGRPAGILLRVVDGVGIVQSLEQLEPDLRRHLREQAPPARATRWGSLFIPGTGQAFTWGRAQGAVWLGGTMALSGYFLLASETVTRAEVIDDEFGNPRTYPYQARERSPWWYAPTTWALSGAASALVSELYVRGKYPDDPATANRSRTSLRVVPFIAEVDGEPALVLSAGFTF